MTFHESGHGSLSVSNPHWGSKNFDKIHISILMRIKTSQSSNSTSKSSRYLLLKSGHQEFNTSILSTPKSKESRIPVLSQHVPSVGVLLKKGYL